AIRTSFIYYVKVTIPLIKDSTRYPDRQDDSRRMTVFAKSWRREQPMAKATTKLNAQDRVILYRSSATIWSRRLRKNGSLANAAHRQQGPPLGGRRDRPRARAAAVRYESASRAHKRTSTALQRRGDLLDHFMLKCAHTEQ